MARTANIGEDRASQQAYAHWNLSKAPLCAIAKATTTKNDGAPETQPRPSPPVWMIRRTRPDDDRRDDDDANQVFVLVVGVLMSHDRWRCAFKYARRSPSSYGRCRRGCYTIMHFACENM